MVDRAFPMSSWAGQTVLITGCGGFLGSWLARALSERSARVVGLFHRTRQPGAVAGVLPSDVIYADVCDAEAMSRIFAQHAIGTVFHLAALTPAAPKDPRLTFEVNTRGAWNVLDASRQATRIPRIVFSSTDSVYGESEGAPFTEDATLTPNYPYEASKACAEMVARCYVKAYGLPVATARFCNLYGPGDEAESRLMAGTIRATLGGRRQVLRGDGSAVRNYLFVGDAVAALLTLAEALERREISGQAFNFCDEMPLSVRDIVSRVVALAGRPDLTPEIGVGTPGEISNKRCSAAKAREILGWRPMTSLDDGLRQTIAWHRSRVAAPASAEHGS